MSGVREELNFPIRHIAVAHMTHERSRVIRVLSVVGTPADISGAYIVTRAYKDTGSECGEVNISVPPPHGMGIAIHSEVVWFLASGAPEGNTSAFHVPQLFGQSSHLPTPG